MVINLLIEITTTKNPEIPEKQFIENTKELLRSFFRKNSMHNIRIENLDEVFDKPLVWKPYEE